ncbi:hypothetical protein [Paenibacillus donghaensis]|uniref:Uncharacterized protein n=1 Tax=Paenibacillus donghaensis TaxID=414771 RepID=A0A2Z2KDJ5_9BACL|nr:hypothetical protein [Paenibacillus donghaensis]ASA24796.1 hypothetical protein B9T62_30980 [Paenibacillus donghaensis]
MVFFETTIINIQTNGVRLIKSKQSIFQTLANEVAKEALQAAELEGDWKEQLYHCTGSIRSALSKYPCSSQLLMRTLPSDEVWIPVQRKKS